MLAKASGERMRRKIMITNLIANIMAVTRNTKAVMRMNTEPPKTKKLQLQ